MLDAAGVSKKLCLDPTRRKWERLRSIGRCALGLSPSKATRAPGEFWAVKSVSLRIGRGDRIAIMGPNGCGKSTLLRLLSGIYRPDEGEVRAHGRVIPVFSGYRAIGAALSGRENARLYLSLMGVSPDELDDRLDAVREFSGLRDKWEAPVRYYSTGMGMRLGISCALHASPDVLLLDEVFSVGDLEFKLRSAEALEKLSDGGAAIVLVTHVQSHVTSFFSRGILMAGGRISHDGDPSELMDGYTRLAQVPAEAEWLGLDALRSKKGRSPF